MLSPRRLFASEVDFPFQRFCLLISFWAANSQTLFSVTLMMYQGLPRGSEVKIHLPVQETQVRSLIWEELISYAVPQLESLCSGAGGHNDWAREPQLVMILGPGACALQWEKPLQREARTPQLGSSPTAWESLHSSGGLAQPKMNAWNYIHGKKNALGCPSILLAQVLWGKLIPPSVAGGIVWLGPDQSQYHISLEWFYGVISQKPMKDQKCL